MRSGEHFAAGDHPGLAVLLRPVSLNEDVLVGLVSHARTLYASADITQDDECRQLCYCWPSLLFRRVDGTRGCHPPTTMRGRCLVPGSHPRPGRFSRRMPAPSRLLCIEKLLGDNTAGSTHPGPAPASVRIDLTCAPLERILPICTKNRYEHLTEALCALRSIVARAEARSIRDRPASAYRCPQCQAWHLTSARPNGRFRLS